MVSTKKQKKARAAQAFIWCIVRLIPINCDGGVLDEEPFIQNVSWEFSKYKPNWSKTWNAPVMSRRWFPRAWIVPLLSLVDFSLWWCDGTVGSWWIATWLLILLLAFSKFYKSNGEDLVMSQWCQWCLETSWNRSLVWAGRAKNFLLLCMVWLIKPWQWIYPGQRTIETRPHKVEQISTTVPKVEQIWTDWTWLNSWTNLYSEHLWTNLRKTDVHQSDLSQGLALGVWNVLESKSICAWKPFAEFQLWPRPFLWFQTQS